MSILKAIFYTLTLTLITILICTTSLFIYKEAFPNELPSKFLENSLQAIATIISFLCVIFLFGLPKEVEQSVFKFKTIKLKFIGPILLLGVSVFLFNRLLWDLFDGILLSEATKKNNYIPFNYLSLDFFGVLIYGSLVAPIIEELFYRKLIFTQLTKRYGLTGAILTSSLLFSLLHLPNYNNLLSTFFLGTLLSLVYYRSKNIIYCICIHALYNTIISIFGIQIALFYDTLNYNELYYILAFVGLILTFISFKWLNQLKS